MGDSNGSWNAKVIGIVVGLALGVVLVFAGALNAFFVALFILVGWIVGKYVAGELDLDDLYDRHLRDRTRKPRK